ncbi:hypothetical protein [Amycolatopsis sp. lyj-112]|uniref:hypothetical protein n=1 Tax=Amycolatopsis sp. lyj-112 TaxID=2789288 RepID=UPI00397C92AA
MRPDPAPCAACVNGQHTWGAAVTEPPRDLTAWTVCLTRRSCACPCCSCKSSELTLTARPHRGDPPTTYLAAAGALDVKETHAVMLTPTVPRHRLPAVALLTADLARYRTPPLPLARRVVSFAEARRPPRTPHAPDRAVMERVLNKLRQLPTTSTQLPLAGPTLEPPS